MIFAETPRLRLRALRRDELSRLKDLLGEWDIVRWLVVVPFPYTLTDAEEFYDDIAPAYQTDEPYFFAVARREDNALIGGVGLHEPRTPDPLPGEIELGYWLARTHWGQGLMSEAVTAVIGLAFARPTVTAIGSTTGPDNLKSQKILRKAGFRDCGTVPRPYPALRGSGQVTVWRLTRADYEGRPASSGVFASSASA